VLNSLIGHREELHIARSMSRQTLLQIRSQMLGEAGEAEVSVNEPGLGALVAVIAVLGTVLMLAGLPAAAGISVLLGLSAPISYALELAATVLICSAALGAAWLATRRRRDRQFANGIALDFD
jgi:hypothetical protein